MTYITGAVPTVKETRTELFFNKSAFLLATNFSDPYFANDLNWAKILLFYRDTSSGSQRQVVVLKDSNSRGWFTPSEFSRTGSWEIETIEVFDKQNDSVRVERANMPSPQDFDIEVQRIIAPASACSVLENYPNLISNGNFDVNANGWTNLSDGSGSTTWEPSQVLRINTPGPGSAARAYTSFNVTTGIRYKVNLDHLSAVSNFILNIYENEPYDNAFATAPLNGNGSANLKFTAIDSQHFLMVETNTSAITGYIDIDNVSVTRIPDKITLESGQAAFWEVGFKCKIWNYTDSVYLTNDVYEVIDITGNDVTLDKQILGDYEGKVLTLRFPTFSESSARQKSKYEYVGSPGY